ncbi:unnamed protein product [Pylaiella littoralis]
MRVYSVPRVFCAGVRAARAHVLFLLFLLFLLLWPSLRACMLLRASYLVGLRRFASKFFFFVRARCPQSATTRHMPRSALFYAGHQQKPRLGGTGYELGCGRGCECGWVAGCGPKQIVFGA